MLALVSRASVPLALVLIELLSGIVSRQTGAVHSGDVEFFRIFIDPSALASMAAKVGPA